MMSKVRKMLKNHPILYCVVVFALISIVFQLFNAAGLYGTALESGWLAVVSLVSVMFLGSSVFSVRSTLKRQWKIILFVTAAGIIIALTTFLSMGITPALDPSLVIQRSVLLLIICFGTGVFEESFFRVLLSDALAKTRGAVRHADFVKTAFISAVIFGLLHITNNAAADSFSGWALGLALLKFLQAGIFGFFMTIFYFRTKNLWLLVVIHTVFNALTMAPQALVLGTLVESYLIGGQMEFLLLALSVVLFLPLIPLALKMVKKIKLPYQTVFDENSGTE